MEVMEKQYLHKTQNQYHTKVDTTDHEEATLERTHFKPLSTEWKVSGNP